MRSARPLLALGLFAAALTACGKEGGTPKPGGPAPAPGGAPAMAAVSGTVLETMDSGGYTYVKLKRGDGSEAWAAVSPSKVTPGETVTVVNAMLMEGFESRTLKRTFDRIYFGQLGSPAAGPGGAAPAAGHGGPPADARAQMAASHAGLSQVPDAGPVDVPKAEGPDARRVAEVFAQKTQLAGRGVTIRGKVVKVTRGVLGRTWIHLRDGSGSAETKDNDITVTTQGTAAVGETVVVTGKVAVDRDFGMGYAYPVLVEEAAIAK